MRSSSTRRAESVPSKRSGLRSFVRGLQLVILLGVSMMCGVALALFISMDAKLPDLNRLEPAEATIIYSSDLTILGRIYREDRTNVPLKDIPQNLRNATIAIEDSRFYQHSGIDIRGIGRAIWENVRRQKLSQGGSTLTQQLARNVYLTQERSVQRKVQEAVIAILMERKFTKDKILELYLNQVFYGSGAFGVQAAARVYFGKDVDQLDLSECALIAGLPQAPTNYSPHKDLEAAVTRRDVVLNRMCEQGYINEQQRDDAKAEKMHIIERMAGRNAYKAPHFVDYVTNQLRERYGEGVLYRGLRVYTTLNYGMQVAAEKALREGVKKHERSRHVTEGCFVAIEPENGYVRAMVGSVNPDSQFNRCTQAMRQPGSSFKAFVYTAALMAGMRPNSQLSNAPTSYPDGMGGYWRPKNYDGNRQYNPTMKVAIAKSINLPAIWTANKIGIRNVIKYAQLMGVKSKLEPYLPTAIGGIGGLHPIEMASAYGTFANDGIHVDSCCIVRVTDNHGQLLEDWRPEPHRVIPEDINAMMDDMLLNVVQNGTGTNAKSVLHARGKTGTTNSDVDAWFIGYVPHKLVAACWVGNDNYKPMRNAFGGSVCAPVWVEFMKKAIPIYDKVHSRSAAAAKPKVAKDPVTSKANSGSTAPSGNDTNEQPLPPAEQNSDTVTVKVCNESGLLATANCPSTHIERPLRGTEPRSYCGIHSAGSDVTARPDNEQPSDVTLVTVKICPDSGMLAGPNCPNPVRKRLPADNVPGQTCNIHTRSRE